MAKKTTPIFIFSLPRSGSTLLLSLLATHKNIAAMAETWLLLPFFFARKNQGVLTSYCHSNAYKGLNDLIDNLPGKEEEYYQYLREFVDKLYTGLADNRQYFVEKTPRYYLVIPEIIRLYPDAKFIFIFRNPVQIFASRLVTYGKNRFSVFATNRSYFDLIDGPRILSNGYELIKDKAIKINYEEFIVKPEEHLRDIFEYLELEYDETILANFDPKKLAGRHMDKNAIEYGNKIVSSTTEKWKTVFNTSYRKKILHNYVSSLDKENLRIMGYDKTEILEEINNLNTGGSSSHIRDAIDYNVMRFKNRYNRISFN